MTITDGQTGLYVPGADSGSTQWLLHRIQLVNWGLFSGHHTIDLDPHATLITGKSGTGKSTIMDAYLALMMPSDVPFNGASNEARGRARSPERRNLLSYLRGQYGATADAEGRAKAQVLRGADRATWGAVAATFVTSEGSRSFTAVRAYYVPVTAARAEDVTMRMVTVPGPVNLPDLQQLVPSRFKPAEVRALFDGARTHDTYQGFVNALESNLGIGTGGNGEKALAMLVRVQSSAQLPDVDTLFKQTVLDPPRTFAQADKALAAFDALDDNYELMLREQERAFLLGPIRGNRATITAAHAELAAHTQARIGSDDGPAALWQARLEYDALDAAITANSTKRTDVGTRHRRAVTDLEDRRTDLNAKTAAYNGAGGAQLVELNSRIGNLTTRLRERHDRLERLARILATAGVTITSRDDLLGLATTATTCLTDLDDIRYTLEEQELAVRVQMTEADHRLREAEADLASFRSRDGRIPRGDHERRCALAAAAGLDPKDLPFVAELIDVAEGQEGWRTAIETVLGSEARHVLVDQATKELFASRIDLREISGRIQFAFATPNQPHPATPDASTVAGKLVHRDTPWAGWVKTNLARFQVNATCVESTGQLADHGFAVTRAGQTRRGQRGAHGRSNAPHIIGFSNADAITAALTAAQAAKTDRDAAISAAQELRTQIGDVDKQRAAWQALAGIDVEDHDIYTAQTTLTAAQDELDRLQRSDDKLADLKKQVDSAAAAYEKAVLTAGLLEDKLTKLTTEHGAFVDRQDAASTTIDVLEQAGIDVDDDLTGRLEDTLTQAALPHDPRSADQLTVLPDVLVRVWRALEDKVATQRDAEGRAAAAIIGILKQYQQRWPDPNLGESLDSYDDYERILDQIETSGLGEQRRRWRDGVLTWSGQDLVPLNQTMEDAVADIQNRLDPVNDVLAHLPFGARGDRLRMDMRRLTPAVVTAFRRELKDISSFATAGLDDDQLAARFVALRQFMAKMRTREDPRAPHEGTNRDQLLDVRRHVEIKAEQVTTDGGHVAYHASLATYSGGETQEVGAFVAGAALRYRLGDDGNNRPRFAPVLIDEAFIKADGEFTLRGVHAWRELGFQLIVGAPQEKVSGIEPAVRRIIAVDKNLEANTSHAYPLKAIEGAA